MNLKTIGIEEPGLNKLIRVTKPSTNYFYIGPKETKPGQLNQGLFCSPSSRKDIHFEKGFIRAETIKYDKLDELGSYTVAKDTGKLDWRRDCWWDGDVMNFRFNT